MANGFFLDVLEVESVKEGKSKVVGVPPSYYATLRLAGGSIKILVKDGIDVPVGWSGIASGPTVVKTYKREFNGKLSDVTVFTPVCIDQFRKDKQVTLSGNSAISDWMTHYQSTEPGRFKKPE